MSNLDPARIDFLRTQGLSYTEIGAELGTTKDAARGAHKRYLARGVPGTRATDAPAVHAPSEGDTAGRLFVPAGVRPEGSLGDSDSAASGGVGVKSEIEMARSAIAKVTRAEIRLKHSLLADAEVNDTLRQRLLDFDRAIQNGYIPSLALKLVAGDA